MNKIGATWRIFSVYMLILILMLFSQTTFGQMKAICFNAAWNKANNIEWFSKLTDVDKETMDIGDGDCQKKYQIAIVPTIVIFKDGEEVKRFQADLSFKMIAKEEEVQEIINEIIMSDF